MDPALKHRVSTWIQWQRDNSMNRYLASGVFPIVNSNNANG